MFWSGEGCVFLTKLRAIADSSINMKGNLARLGVFGNFGIMIQIAKREFGNGRSWVKYLVFEKGGANPEI